MSINVIIGTWLASTSRGGQSVTDGVSPFYEDEERCCRQNQGTLKPPYHSIIWELIWQSWWSDLQLHHVPDSASPLVGGEGEGINSEDD